ncbi:uncharacterized protein LOC111306157 [Durio zibethinus]|uniref:Uncharacterized protein LOC111306157 n=1 Tax=Durio zibethinus TaxID=66656 RepID=A0A6P6A462_DURZI|nr:uncharacterized protein LOC111306157 [Durio zibethinus]
MSLRHRYLRKVSSFLPHFSSGYHYQPSKRVFNSVVFSSSSPLPHQCNEINTRFPETFSGTVQFQNYLRTLLLKPIYCLSLNLLSIIFKVLKTTTFFFFYFEMMLIKLI